MIPGMTDSQTEHTLAWQAGYNAGLSLGSDDPPCPYADGTLAAEWRNGFIEGRVYRDVHT